MKIKILSPVTAFFIFLLVFWSCKTTEKATVSQELSKIPADGIYTYDFQRVTEMVQSEFLYKNSGINYNLFQVASTEGCGVEIQSGRLLVPEFIDYPLTIQISSDGKISSPENESLNGKILPDGRIFWHGFFQTRGQTYFLTESAVIGRKSAESLAPESMNGSYECDAMHFVLKDGLAKSEFGSFTVDSNGEFKSDFSLKIIQNMNGQVNASTLANGHSAGKINADGSISFEISAGADSGIEGQEKKYAVSGFKSSSSTVFKQTSGPSISPAPETENQVAREKKDQAMESSSKKNLPEWFSYTPVEKNGKLQICAWNSSKSKSVAKSMALAQALAELASCKSVRILSESKVTSQEDSKESKGTLFEVFESQSVQETDYEIINSYADKESKTFYIQIQEK